MGLQRRTKRFLMVNVLCNSVQCFRDLLEMDRAIVDWDVRIPCNNKLWLNIDSNDIFILNGIALFSC